MRRWGGSQNRRVIHVWQRRRVLAASRLLILDPLVGHPPARTLITDADLRGTIRELGLEEVVGDKGYHSNQELVDLKQSGSAAIFRNRIADGATGRTAARRLPESPAHSLRARASVSGCAASGSNGACASRRNLSVETRVLRGHGNTLQRVLIHTVGLNLGLLMRALCRPRACRAARSRFFPALEVLIRLPVRDLVSTLDLARGPSRVS